MANVLMAPVLLKLVIQILTAQQQIAAHVRTTCVQIQSAAPMMIVL